MNYFKKSILLALFISPIALSEVSHFERVSGYLNFFIGPSGEDDQSIQDSIQVSECVAKKAKDSWSERHFNDFDVELSGFIDKIESEMADPQALMLKGPSRPSEKLQKELKSLLPFVEYCESKVGAEVEF
ncbi:hypothetical protein CTT31_19840 [Pseudoalteromonas maricaloris]|uniref:hypothetical protein n=1 Tax=Pseudoalteromonas maricaloris TaxID=184924 RepID=UPI0021AD94D0|nr:hypothetical protein [Pseudoalteromonas flavipulchra]USE71340.1 hypothetical protein CTT31_19840 [Pseudoalteromonas flavipulchra]